MNWRSGALVLSALGLALLLGVPGIGTAFPLSVINTACFFADTLFHELGHAVFSWVFGCPSIPAIFTLFGSDQAGGIALTFERSWAVQLAVWAAMGYGVWWLWRQDRRGWAAIAAGVSAVLFVLSFWRHYPLVGLYMGHGSAIVMGGFFLYRGLMDLAARHAVERWLNVFLGCYMLLRNGGFAWLLAFNADARAEYSELKIFGAGHHDLMAMQEEWPWLTVQGIAQATLFFVAATVAVTLVLAYLRRLDDGVTAWR